MDYINTYNLIKRRLNPILIGRSSTRWGRTDGGIVAKTLRGFNLPKESAFAIKICNQSRQIVFEKNFDTEREFQNFCDTYTKTDLSSFFSSSVKTMRVNSIDSFAKTFFFPTTTAMHPDDSPLQYLLAIIWDLGTLFCRLLTLPYRFYEYTRAPQHPLLKDGIITDTTEPYVDIYCRAQQCANNKIANVLLGKRIFLERHAASQASSYCEEETNALPLKDRVIIPQASSKYPNPKTREDMCNRLGEHPFIPPTEIEARKFFDLAPNFTQEQLASKFRKTMRTYHPDKIFDDGSCAKWINKCRDALKAGCVA